MNSVVISCKTIEKELLAAMRESGYNYPVLFLEAGLHNTPGKLKDKIQNYLDRCAGFDTVLLAMGFCGNAVIGLRSHNFQFIMPRCNDCIDLLLGERARPFATIFLTEGWLTGGRHLGQEYDACLTKYGLEKGQRIFGVMLAHYRCLAMLDTKCFDTSAAAKDIQAIAKKLGLTYTVIEGSLDYLKNLLRGEWAKDRFTILPPYTTITSAHCAAKGACHGI